MTGVQRTVAWTVVSAGLITSLVAVVVSAQAEHPTADDGGDEQSQELSRALAKVAGAAGATGTVGWVTFATISSISPYDALGFAVGLGIFALKAGVIWILRSHTMGERITRQFILAGMVYGAIGFIGLAAREHGCCGNIDESERILRVGSATVVALISALGLLMVVGWWYGREENRIRTPLKRLAFLETRHRDGHHEASGYQGKSGAVHRLRFGLGTPSLEAVWRIR